MPRMAVGHLSLKSSDTARPSDSRSRSGPLSTDVDAPIPGNGAISSQWSGVTPNPRLAEGPPLPASSSRLSADGPACVLPGAAATTMMVRIPSHSAEGCLMANRAIRPVDYARPDEHMQSTIEYGLGGDTATEGLR